MRTNYNHAGATLTLIAAGLLLLLVLLLLAPVKVLYVWVEQPTEDADEHEYRAPHYT